MRLAGKIAVVTGAGSDIGKALVKGLSAEGAKLAIAARSPAEATEAERLARERGAEAFSIAADVTSEGDVNRLAADAVSRFGRIDVMVNGEISRDAKISNGRWDNITPKTWDSVIAVHIRGAFLGCRAVLPYMRSQGGGSIINLTSPDAIYGGPLLHYTAAAAGVMSFSRALARQVGQIGVRVNCVAPGSILIKELSDGIPPGEPSSGIPEAFRSLKRPGQAEDLVGAVLMLAADESSYITGQTIVVDGGYAYH